MKCPLSRGCGPPSRTRGQRTVTRAATGHDLALGQMAAAHNR
jgi:hypothetical protein